MSDVNITEVRLLNVPIESDYKITLYFPDKTTQENYFKSKVISNGIFTDFSYQRKDHFIRIPLHFDDAIKCNYVMYQNKAYSNKWFYAFVKDVKYVDDGRSDIYIETDCMQTWLGDYTVKPSFVEREHTIDDTIGANTVPETLERGEYICNTSQFNDTLRKYVYIVGTTVSITTSASGVYGVGGNVGSGLYNGVMCGWRYYAFTSASDVDGVLKAFADAGKSDAIVSIFYMPQYYVKYNSETHEVAESVSANGRNWSGSDNNFGSEISMPDSAKGDSITKPTKIDGYTPKNKKLLTYPYCYLLMSNLMGNSVVYHYELFNMGSNGKTCEFWVYSAITPGGSIRLLPSSYGGYDTSGDGRTIGSGYRVEHGVNLGKLPVCGWQNDIYTNWLTQNSKNIQAQKVDAQIGIASSIFNMASGIVGSTMSRNMFGGINSGVNGGLSTLSSMNQIKHINAEIYAHSLQPPAAEGNINCGDVMGALKDITFGAYQMSIKREYAKIIDDFFTMFGYATNRVKRPNSNKRKRFWYTKTIDVNIDGAIPNKDLQVIRNCYNNGITFWKYSDSKIGTYPDGTSELDNPIV